MSTLNNNSEEVFVGGERGLGGNVILGGGVWTPLFGGGRTQFSVRVES